MSALQILIDSWRLGNLLHRWAGGPLSITREELYELRSLAAKFGIDVADALYRFQEMWHAENGSAVSTDRPDPPDSEVHA